MADFVAAFLVASQFKPCRANNRDTELFWLVFVAAMEETGSNGTISDVDIIGGVPLKAGFRSDYMGSNMRTGRRVGRPEEKIVAPPRLEREFEV